MLRPIQCVVWSCVLSIVAPLATFAADDAKKPAAKQATESKQAEKPTDEQKSDAKNPDTSKKPDDAKKPGNAKKPETAKPDAKKPTAGPKPNPREYKSGKEWKEPKVITPGAAPGDPPNDAIALFDGQDLTKEFVDADEWTVAEGVATVAGRKSIKTRRSFGSCQLHLEWAAPSKVSGEGQGRGNSGAYLMNTYEVQILDSYENKTYFDGQAASIYKQTPPLVNACRKPGEWQTYDIIFTAPKFADDGKLESPAYVTVLHNGVLVQNHFELEGGTFFDRPPSYTKHAPKLPLQLQNHGNPMRFRNIWIREL